APMFQREHPPGAAEAGLHLVDAEEGSVAAAELLCALEVAGGGDVDALALHRLDDEERDVLRAQLSLERREVVPGHFLEARRQRVDAELHGARPVELQRLDESLADARVVSPDVEHAEAAEHVEVAVAVRVPEVRALCPGPAAVEADRPQQADELRVDRLRVQV